MSDMKNLNYYILGIALLGSLANFSSCSTVFFDSPEPVDSPNLEYIPKEIQGTWKNTGKNYSEIIRIDKNSFHRITIQKQRIAKRLADSSGMYRIISGKIYISDEENCPGYPYMLVNDTIHFTRQNDDQAYVLSDSVLLRASRNGYVASLRNMNFWEIVFIHKTRKGAIQISYPLSEDLLKMTRKYNIAVMDSSRTDSIFFHARLSSSDIENAVNRRDEGLLYTLSPDSTFVNSSK
jgi:hypothetical protein